MSARYQSEDVDPAPLGKPLHFEFANRTAPNRFLKAAMTERLSSWDPKVHEKRGVPSDNLINVYKRWGEGQYGVILTGNVMIAYDHLEAPGNPIVPPEAKAEPGDARFDAFKKMAEVSKAHGSLVVAQVSHPGRQVEQRIQPNPLSASDIQLEGEIMGLRFAKPHAASIDEIKTLKKQWVHSAQYLQKAGYDGIQLHGAHGYLLAQFLSQTTNKRTDQYGGSLENRARIITEIADEIREVVPTSTGFILGIKINSVEFQQSGFSPEEAKELVSLLETHKFDFVELSGGTYESLAFQHKRESTVKRESFFIEFAEQITPGLKHTRSYITGGLKTVGAMIQALNAVDGVGLARPATQEFRLPKDILEGRVKGAIEQKIDQNNFGLTNVAAGTQIRQVGKDQDPIDLSKQENVDGFMKDMGTWGQKMQEDAASMGMYGYVDIQSVESRPYGAQAA
ncbi:hypothetical protein LTR64_003873 [Lithohypha guttulata]|uniref:NADH:flavin oxidoreductase/NADH oxidase N-terminal domain-containing protein n=1 Tax=Lithohypha guttulata TaxID=1690604 RepID=A0AAN7T5E1_9EURO|nr:hypothetical protein LTR51_006911 [Lithohypha guttulata]KAK5089048.1 hypothetical protein LTR05_003272 [Lithohypha guttulata]